YRCQKSRARPEMRQPSARPWRRPPKRSRATPEAEWRARRCRSLGWLRGSVRRQGRGLGRDEGAVIAVEQLRNGGGRHVEHRLRIESEQDSQSNQGAERDQLTIIEVLYAREARLGERSENDLAVEPQR